MSAPKTSVQRSRKVRHGGDLVYICIRTEPHPETRVDHGANITEVIGVAPTQDLADELNQITHSARLHATALDEGFSSIGAFRQSPDFYDPDSNADYVVHPFQMYQGSAAVPLEVGTRTGRMECSTPNLNTVSSLSTEHAWNNEGTWKCVCDTSSHARGQRFDSPQCSYCIQVGSGTMVS